MSDPEASAPFQLCCCQKVACVYTVTLLVTVRMSGYSWTFRVGPFLLPVFYIQRKFWRCGSFICIPCISSEKRLILKCRCVRERDTLAFGTNVCLCISLVLLCSSGYCHFDHQLIYSTLWLINVEMICRCQRALSTTAHLLSVAEKREVEATDRLIGNFEKKSILAFLLRWNNFYNDAESKCFSRISTLP